MAAGGVPPVRPLTQPAHARVWRLGLELLLVVLAITLTAMLLRAYARPWTYKAQLTEALFGLSTARTAVVEDYAHTGAWSSAQGVDPEQRDKRISISETTHIDRVGDILIASGKIGGRAFTLPVRPAVPAHSENWTMMFFCGTAQPPAGWQAAPLTDTSYPAASGLPHVCRSGAPR